MTYKATDYAAADEDANDAGLLHVLLYAYT